MRSGIRRGSLFFMIFLDFVPTDGTVNQHFYLGVLKRVLDDIMRKPLLLRRSGGWFLQPDNEVYWTTPFQVYRILRVLKKSEEML